jgi:hypothetical protein
VQRSIGAAFADPASLALAFLLAPLFAGLILTVTGIFFGIVTAQCGVLNAIESGLFLLVACIIGAAAGIALWRIARPDRNGKLAQVKQKLLSVKGFVASTLTSTSKSFLVLFSKKELFP